MLTVTGMALAWRIFVFVVAATRAQMQLSTSQGPSANPASPPLTSNSPTAVGGDLDIPNVDVRMIPQKRLDSCGGACGKMTDCNDVVSPNHQHRNDPFECLH